MPPAWDVPKAARGLVERDVPQGIGLYPEKVSRLPAVLSAGGSGKLVLRGLKRSPSPDDRPRKAARLERLPRFGLSGRKGLPWEKAQVRILIKFHKYNNFLACFEAVVEG